MGLTFNLGRVSPSVFTDSSLNVGIGAAPSGTYKLEVTGTAKVSGILTLSSTISNGTYTYTLPSATGTLALTSALGDYLPLAGGTLTGALVGTSASFSSTATATAFIPSGATVPTNGMYLSAANTINFATNTINRLQISSTGITSILGDGASLVYQAKTANADLYLEYKNSAGTRRAYIGYGGVSSSLFEISNSENSAIDFRTNATFAMRIASGGNIGIGTNNPLTLLHLNSPSGTNATIYFGVNGTANGFLGQAASAGSLASGAAIGDIVLRSQTNLLFTSGGDTERMRITSGGNILIGTTSDNSAKLQVSGAFYSSLTAATAWAVYTDCLATSGNPYGNVVSFSNQSPNNSASYMYYGGDSTGARFIVRGNGGISNYQANDTNLSDLRLKKDILPLESYWEKFKAIEIVKFKYIDQTHDDYNIGVIAQQVESVAPEFVDIDGWNKPKLDEDGNEILSDEEPLKSIYTADLHHATIKVLQEAITRIEEQQAIITSLQDRLDKAGL